MSLTKNFDSCKFVPATTDTSGNPTSITSTPIGSWKTTSFFIDSSGRSTFELPLLLSFSTKEDLDEFLAAKCLDPAPQNIVGADGEDATTRDSETSVGFEVKSYSVDEAKTVAVESVIISNCSVDSLTVRFELNVTVRASNHHYEAPKDDSSLANPNTLSVVTNLEITPVLTTKHASNQQGDSGVSDGMALELVAIPDQIQKGFRARTQETHLSSIRLNLTLTHAFTISMKSVAGPSLGKTLISLAIRHSNSHPEYVTISNICKFRKVEIGTLSFVTNSSLLFSNASRTFTL
jgi:hypothetical protein